MKKFGNISPCLGQRVYVASSADVIGNVTVGNDSSIWFQTVVRGDVDKIVIGSETNIQDLSMLHVSKGFPLSIGDKVTVGHHVVLHGCIIENNCLIGIGAIINDGAVIGKGSVVAAGTLIPPGKTFPENSLIMGSPGKVKRALTDEEKILYHNHYKKYVINKNLYLLEKI
jgi:carbonic anhydrase/acetyltransferase-like protein (isoleucine patch superfamily)